MRAAQPFKRIYLINRDFQLKYARIAVFVGLGSTILTMFLILYPLFYMRVLRFPDFLPSLFLWGIAIAALLNFSMIAFLGILLTHRVAGPMYSLVRQMRSLQSGRLQVQLRVRAGDDLKFVIRNFNEMIEYLNVLTKRDLTRAEQVVEGLQNMKQDAGELERVLQISEELRQDLGQRLQKPPEPPAAAPSAAAPSAAAVESYD